MLLPLLLAFQLAQPPAAPAVDTAGLRLGLLAEEQRFVERWRKAWEASEDARRPDFAKMAVRSVRGDVIPPGPWADRLDALHCHEHDPTRPTPPRRIASKRIAQGQCPTWSTGGAQPTDDASLVVDSALDAGVRPRIAKARRELLRTIAATVAAAPTDGFIVGRYVRFLVDAGEPDSALAVARACRARAPLCARLAGYVLAWRGDLRAADSAFTAARALMTPTERCAWDDASDLLPPETRDEYARLSCDARETVDARLWWLARPLLSDAVHDRRVEQDFRRVYLELHATGADERHEWAPARGGDALVAMYLRYGVPSSLWWGGGEQDRGHDGWLEARGIPISPPYTAPGYARVPERLHLLPTWRAVRAPFEARPDDWELLAPGEAPPPRWWPVEHYRRRAGQITALPEGQEAFLRRAHAPLLAVALTVPRGLDASQGAVLVASPHPDSLFQLALATPDAARRVVLAASLGTGPSLLGVETIARPGAPAGRLRHGVRPPPSLQAMARGERAVSEPLLFAPGTAAEASRADPDSAIARMLPSTVLRGPGRRVGVYWESYGFARGDTVDVAVRVEAEAPSLAQRAAAALLLTDVAEGGLSVRWREPRPNGVVRVVDAAHAALGRGIVLELSRLTRGDYWIEVSVGRPGAAPARARRRITLE